MSTILLLTLTGLSRADEDGGRDPHLQGAGLPPEQLLEQSGLFHLEIGRDIADNRVKGSEANFLVCGHGHVVLDAFCLAGETNVAPGLTTDLVAVTTKERGERPSVEVAWELQAGITPSFTRWRRISRGALWGSKWQRTASCTMAFSPSSVSA